MWIPFSMAVCSRFLPHKPDNDPRQKRQAVKRDKGFKGGFERVTASFRRFSVLSGGDSNPGRRSSSHSEASRLNSRQVSKRREKRKREKLRLLLKAFTSLSTLRFRSERRRRGASVSDRGLRGFVTRVEAMVGVKLIALQDIVGSELHEGGKRQFRRA